MTVCFKGRINFFTLLFTVCSAVMISGCRKAESTVGDDLLGDMVGFNNNFSDTSSIIAYTSPADSLLNRNMYYFYLGKMNDPEFGTTNAAAVMQFAMPIAGNIPNLANVNIDSIVLQVKYVSASSYYGNKNTPQVINVYELAENLSADSAYATNRNFIYDAANSIGSWQGKFDNMGDSVKFSYAGASVSLPPHLRIKLDNPAFIQKFKDARTGLSDLDKLRSKFKGLVVSAEATSVNAGDGAIAYIHLRNGSDFGNVVTSVVLYYDSAQKVEFPIYTDVNVKANAISHSHNITIPVQPLMGGIHKDVNYVQSLGGLKTRILIPNLFNYIKNKNIAITGAQLIVTAADGADPAPYTVPASLQLEESDSIGLDNLSTDLIAGGPSFYGGTYNSATKQYSFNIVRRVQYLLQEYRQHNRNYNYGFNLYVYPNPATAGRVIIDTRPGKIKLKISYTVIN